MTINWILSTILFAGTQGFSYGGSLREIWKLDLSAAIDAPTNQKLTNVPVYAIRFSPDGKQIAVSVRLNFPHGDALSKLLVVQSQHPNDAIRKFDIQGEANDDFAPMTWSPSADGIAAGESVIRLDNGKICNVMGWRGPKFIGSNRVLNMALPRDHQKFILGDEPTRFNILDRDCQLRDSWDLEHIVTIGDVSAERGLLNGYLFTLNPKKRLEGLLIDSITKTILRTSPVWGGAASFALHGKAICSGFVAEGLAKGEAVVRCFDVDSGKTIAESSSLRGGGGIFAAESASRIILPDVRTVRVPFGEPGDYGTMRRLVWDFQTNKELVSWDSSTQTFDVYDRNGPKQVKEPFHVAISPDGRFIAEGGNGILYLYEIAL